MKIFDCFQFFDEDMMLDLRMNILDQHVDKFVIVENLYMHSGKKKSQNFKIEKYKKFEKKIKYILVNKLPEDLIDLNSVKENEKTNTLIDNTLKIEHNQRNKLFKGLDEAHKEDLIMISDVDEIPNLENIEKKNQKKNNMF